MGLTIFSCSLFSHNHSLISTTIPWFSQPFSVLKIIPEGGQPFSGFHNYYMVLTTIAEKGANHSLVLTTIPEKGTRHSLVVATLPEEDLTTILWLSQPFQRRVSQPFSGSDDAIWFSSVNLIRTDSLPLYTVELL